MLRRIVLLIVVLGLTLAWFAFQTGKISFPVFGEGAKSEATEVTEGVVDDVEVTSEVREVSSAVVEETSSVFKSFADIAVEKVDKAVLDDVDRKYLKDLYIEVRELTSLTDRLGKFVSEKDDLSTYSAIMEVSEVCDKILSFESGKGLGKFKTSVNELVLDYSKLVERYGLDLESGSVSIAVQNQLVDCLNALNRFSDALDSGE